MNAKKGLSLFLVSCLFLCAFFCLGVSAADGSGAGGGISTFALVSLIIGGVAILVAVVLCIVYREKVAETISAYRSEMKKVTWFSWKNVVASTVFVLVTIVVVAAVAYLFDQLFFQGQRLLGELVR
jgi:preprotein translocase SecE subunit